MRKLEEAAIHGGLYHFPKVLGERELSDEVNLWVFHAVQQHQRYDRHGSGFSNFASLIKTQLLTRHSAKVDPFSKSKRARFSAEARKSMNSIVAVAAVSPGGRVMEDEQGIRKGFLEPEKGEIERLVHSNFNYHIGASEARI